ncbi:MAG TPA: zf-HC2 domain-containing protein [Bryobacteraceae bacterium]|jgi:anti-sigma factor RsiW|nr:zf-HC2 domain-containing protein [Bryobacteraceae bacterium]
MCEYSGRLIAWLDRELPDDEATNVEWHVGQCAECRKAVSEYREVSDAFLACYERQMETSASKPHLWRWAAAFAGVAASAAIAAFIVLAQPSAEKLAFHPPSPRPPAAAPIVAARARVPLRHRTVPSPTRHPWMAEEPVVEVALPADALFPPGAVPEGFSFIADVRFQQ